MATPKNAIQPIDEAVRYLQKYIESKSEIILGVLPRKDGQQRMMRLLRAAITRRPKLTKCDKFSLLCAIVESAMLGLEVETPLGHAWIIPFKNNKTGKHDAVLMIGYQGYIELCYRSGKVKAVWAEIVHENDTFQEVIGTDPCIAHEPNREDPGAMKGAYAVMELDGGGKIFRYMPKAEVMKHKDASPARNSSDSPWNDPRWEADMWRKTAILAVQKYAPKSAEMAQAASLDTEFAIGRNQSFSLVKEVQRQQMPILGVESGKLEDAQQRVDAAKKRKPPEQAPPPGEWPTSPQAPAEEEEPPSAPSQTSPPSAEGGDALPFPSPAGPVPDGSVSNEDGFYDDAGEPDQPQDEGPAKPPPAPPSALLAAAQEGDIGLVDFANIGLLEDKATFFTRAVVKSHKQKQVGMKQVSDVILAEPGDGDEEFAFVKWGGEPKWLGVGVTIEVIGKRQGTFRNQPKFVVDKWEPLAK